MIEHSLNKKGGGESLFVPETKSNTWNNLVHVGIQRFGGRGALSSINTSFASELAVVGWCHSCDSNNIYVGGKRKGEGKYFPNSGHFQPRRWPKFDIYPLHLLPCFPPDWESTKTKILLRSHLSRKVYSSLSPLRAHRTLVGLIKHFISSSWIHISPSGSTKSAF